MKQGPERGAERRDQKQAAAADEEDARGLAFGQVDLARDQPKSKAEHEASDCTKATDEEWQNPMRRHDPGLTALGWIRFRRCFRQGTV